jgi:hypothetical protein
VEPSSGVAVVELIERAGKDTELERRIIELADLPKDADASEVVASGGPWQAFEAFERWR